MAKLDTEERKDLPKKDFALPKEKEYPIENEAHARDALARASADASPEEKHEIAEKVHEKYPGIDKGGKGKLHDWLHKEKRGRKSEDSEKKEE